jgi:Na+/H+ antiporter NhaD/arsenite permease-like protein
MSRTLNVLAGLLVALYFLLQRGFGEQIARKERGEPLSDRQRQSLRRLVVVGWGMFGAFVLLGLWQLALHGYLPVAAALALALGLAATRSRERLEAMLEDVREAAGAADSEDPREEDPGEEAD